MKCKTCNNDIALPDNANGDTVYRCSKCLTVVYYPVGYFKENLDDKNIE